MGLVPLIGRRENIRTDRTFDPRIYLGKTVFSDLPAPPEARRPLGALDLMAFHELISVNFGTSQGARAETGMPACIEHECRSKAGHWGTIEGAERRVARAHAHDVFSTRRLHLL